jgi:hypothetical protein
MAMTGTEPMRAHRERRRPSIRKLTIEVSEDDLCEIAKAGYGCREQGQSLPSAGRRPLRQRHSSQFRSVRLRRSG